MAVRSITRPEMSVYTSQASSQQYNNALENIGLSSMTTVAANSDVQYQELVQLVPQRKGERRMHLVNIFHFCVFTVERMKILDAIKGLCV